MTDPVPFAPWWKLNIHGHAIHVNADGSYWWWDRVRMFTTGRRPHFYLRQRGQFRPRGRLSSWCWYGRCTPWEKPVVIRAFTFRGLNRKSDRAREAHYAACGEHPSRTPVVVNE